VSTFNPGTGGDLVSTNLPAAFFELARLLDAAENARNGANPGVAPKQNLTVTVDFGTRVASIAASLPITASPSASGQTQITAVDYLSPTFSAFNPGTGGTLKSTTSPSALLELGQILSNAEKAVVPAEDQPNNLQVTYDLETGTATITANLPITTSADTDGAVKVIASDYL